jgi:acyl-CoA dehydrogenase
MTTPTDAEPPAREVGWDLDADAYAPLRARVRTFVADQILPDVDAWEAVEAFPRELYRTAAAAGLFGWKVTAGFGGTGPDLLADAVVGEELAGCWSGGVAAGLGAHKDLGPYYIWRFGTDEQRTRWVVPALAGEQIGALAVTEPGAGSDVAGLRTRAERRDGDWVLNGAKTFITNGTWADQVVVAAVTDPDAGGHHGLSLFVVEPGDAGFERRRIRTLGWRTSHTGELAFTDVRLPDDRLLGGEALRGQGFVCIMRNFQWERVGMALGAVRASQDVLALVAAEVPHVLTGAGDGAVRARLVEVATRLAAARRLTDHALRLAVQGIDAVREVSMAKWFACVVAVEVAEAALQALPPRAGLARVRVERALRDARLGPIGGGTTQIMKEVVGRAAGL